MTKEQKCWKMIEDAKWKLDHDYKRISTTWAELPSDEFKMLEDFIDSKVDKLMYNFEPYWLGQNGFNDGDGIPASDDSWSDLCYDVIGRGERFYDSITAEKLLEMAKNHDYEESFAYCLQID
jgi:hypothetical protein